MAGLVWIQNIWQTHGIPDKFFVIFFKKKKWKKKFEMQKNKITKH